MGYVPPKNIYEAKIGDRSLKVDIYDLPYDEFTAENPLIVMGMVVLADQSRTTNLENVQIIGGLDISKQKYSIVLPKVIKGKFICRSHTQMRDITDTKQKIDIFHDGFIFPKGVTEIDCSHSIPTLSFLKGRIPETVQKIIVADSLLSNITSDIEKLVEARFLLQQYPNVIIAGDKKGKTLSESVIKPTEPVIINQEKIDDYVHNYDNSDENSEDLLMVKTEEYNDIKDILKKAKDDIIIKSFKILDSALEREIRKLMAKFNKQFLKNPKTGGAVFCIKKDDVPDLLEMLITELQLNEDKKLEAARKKEEFLKAKTKQAEEKPVVKEDTSLIPVAIKKYIPKTLWQKIKNLCGKKDSLIGFVLQTINSVNTDINETSVFRPVQIINEQEKVRTSCAYLQKELGKCIVQSINNVTSKDKKRIVWTFLPEEKILVCTSVYREHFCISGQNTESLKYSKSLSCAAKGLNDASEEITLQKIKDEEYLDIEVLLTQYPATLIKEPKTKETRSGKNSQTKTKQVILSHHVSSASVETTDAEQPQKNIIKRPYNIPSTHIENTEQAMQIKSSGENYTVDNTSEILKIENIVDLTDIQIAKTKIQAVIDLINKEVNKNLIAATQEQDAYKQIDILQQVQEILIEKEKMQKILPDLSKTEEVLKEFLSHQR